MKNGLEAIETKLAIVVDPPNQNPKLASSRVDEFIQRGGRAILIGGSGPIEATIFQDTVASIVEATTQYSSIIPIWIFPGHISQIPINGKGISGLLNYRYIMGSGGNDFHAVYPPQAREKVLKTLEDRKIESIPTLYILCGNPNASVSKVSGILPLDLTYPSINQRFLKDTEYWLKSVNCVYFESGSGTEQPVNRRTIIQTRHLIDKLKARALLFVSGGIKNPDHARLYAGIADYVVVGGHFETNGVKDTNEFVGALKV